MVIKNVALETVCGITSTFPENDKMEVAFAGKSNVGKSSLINAIMNRKSLARTSAQPGKTATINFYRLKEFRMVDLPGYGYAKVSKAEKERWAKLVEGYFAQDRKRAHIIQILDLRHPPTDDDLHMIDFLYRSGFNFAAVLTKSDKLKKTQFEEQLEYYKDIFSTIEDINLIPFSAKTGLGNEEIRKLIEVSINDLVQSEV